MLQGQSAAANFSTCLRHVSYPHGLLWVCGSDPIMFGAHRLRAVNAFERAHGEMPAREAMEILDKGKIDRGAAESADNRYSLNRKLLGDDGAKPRNNRRERAMRHRRGAMRGTLMHRGIHGERQAAGKQYPQREIATLRTLGGGSGVPQREDLEAGETGARV
jgi:hypothetical protein